MSDQQDGATPPSVTTSGSTAETGPASEAGPTASEAGPTAPEARPTATFAPPISGRHLGATWQIVVALAVVVGLLTGIVTLLDRFTAAPTPTPTPVPTTPSIKVDISSTVGAAELVSFVESESGKLVDLDLSCFETVVAPACILEGSGLEVEPGGDEELLVWLFTGTPCFAPLIDQPIETRDYSSCQGTSVLWIDPRTDGSPVVLSNIQGASTTAIKGPWELADLGGGGVFPGNIHAYRLTPHLTRPAVGPALSPGVGVSPDD